MCWQQIKYNISIYYSFIFNNLSQYVQSCTCFCNINWSLRFPCNSTMEAREGVQNILAKSELVHENFSLRWVEEGWGSDKLFSFQGVTAKLSLLQYNMGPSSCSTIGLVCQYKLWICVRRDLELRLRPSSSIKRLYKTQFIYWAFVNQRKTKIKNTLCNNEV